MNNICLEVGKNSNSVKLKPLNLPLMKPPEVNSKELPHHLGDKDVVFLAEKKALGILKALQWTYWGDTYGANYSARKIFEFRILLAHHLQGCPIGLCHPL
ncbi:hypothetical protein Tco_1533594 [Tanacetum coccineum]